MNNAQAVQEPRKNEHFLEQCVSRQDEAMKVVYFYFLPKFVLQSVSNNWLVANLCKLALRIQDKLAETLPSAAGVLVPPGYQLGDEYEYLGFTSQEMNEFAFTALSRRLKVIGVGLPAVAA